VCDFEGLSQLTLEPNRRSGSFSAGGAPMSKETSLDDPQQQTDQGSHSQTDKPWKGNPKTEQC
jgi:hypothetical protein